MKRLTRPIVAGFLLPGGQAMVGLSADAACRISARSARLMTLTPFFPCVVAAKESKLGTTHQSVAVQSRFSPPSLSCRKI